MEKVLANPYSLLIWWVFWSIVIAFVALVAKWLDDI